MRLPLLALLALAVSILLAPAAEAGPVRDRLRARLGRPAAAPVVARPAAAAPAPAPAPVVRLPVSACPGGVCPLKR